MSEAATIEEASPPSSQPSPPGEGGSQAVVVDAAAISGARQSLEAATKNLGKSAKDVFEKAFELQQLSMFGEAEFEEALLFDDETRRKKYTGEQAEKMEWRRDLCLYLLSRDTPREDIGRLLKMNLRTITALAAQHGRKLGAFTEDFANRLIASASSDIALADTKRDEASHKDLHIAAGIKMQHAIGVKMMSDTSQQPAIDVEQADDKLKAFREELKKLEEQNSK